MNKKIIIGVILLALIGGGYGFYLYNKPVESLNAAKAEAEVTAVKIYADFIADETAATEKYLNKIVQISGTISEVSSADGSSQITLEAEDEMGIEGVVCELEKDVADTYKVGDAAIFKGECTGYLELSGVNIARCVEVK